MSAPTFGGLLGMLYGAPAVLAADSVSSIGKVGAAVGVVVVIWQLALTYLANARRLGADFVDMYERVIERVPLGMLFGESTL